MQTKKLSLSRACIGHSADLKKVVVNTGRYLLSDELEVVDEVTGYTGESCAQLLSLAGNSYWAVVGVADTCLLRQWRFQ